MVKATTDTAGARVITSPPPTRSGRIEANGVHYYYESHGAGEPLLLLQEGTDLTFSRLLSEGL